MRDPTNYNAGLYLRLSKDDDQAGESVSIGTQRSILTDFCRQSGFIIYKIYVDDGYSGLNFERPGFKELLEDVDRGVLDVVITKDLSRLGRDYIMTGYYSEIFFQSKGVRYIAVADDFDSAKGGNDIAPFRNILNDMYARDISRKIRNAKQQRARKGLFIGAQAPYGYCKDPRNRNHLVIDPEAATVVRLIFSLAEQGLGSVAIAAELQARRIVAPSVYKYQRGDERFAHYPALQNGDHCAWCPATISQILKNQVYLGTLTNLKTETVNYKTKQRVPVLEEHHVVVPNAHAAIVTQDQFDVVQQMRSQRKCAANEGRFNLFRGKLFCECCGHPLMISKKTVEIQSCGYLPLYVSLCPSRDMPKDPPDLSRCTIFLRCAANTIFCQKYETQKSNFRN